MVYKGPGISTEQLENLLKISQKKTSRDSVGNYAEELKKNIELFICQLEEAGLGRKQASDFLTDKAKWTFLQYLKNK